jgi:malonyl-CoA/methylmalonyl-CoA synthetase
VLLPLSVLTAQSQSLIEAWQYGTHDVVLNVMPLHHLHGILTALITPLFAGCTIELHHPFNPTTVLERFARPIQSAAEVNNEKITVFTAVPTMYSLMIETHQRLPAPMQKAVTIALSRNNLRLNICGSAALPTPLMEGWNRISNDNYLLQRYGMTEVGMAISCGLPFGDRIDGSVGWPLPMVQVRLVDVETQQVIEYEESTESVARSGELQLRGPTIFTEYWHNPAATESEMIPAIDGGKPWFRTGDIAVRRKVEGTGNAFGNTSWTCGPMYFIQGRKNTDILKSGGEKVSALEVERELLAL